MQDEAIRQKIVAAARERFAHYGYGKTTMAELAGDCNMSPGNLYRYFPGKLDIAEAIVRGLFERTLETLRAIALGPELTASEKLKAVLEKLLEITYEDCKHATQLYEMAQAVSRERPEFAQHYLDAHAALLGGILAEGKARGELWVADPGKAARCLQLATAKFQNPPLWTRCSLADLKEQLAEVTDAILAGLRPPTRPQPSTPTESTHP
jgi:AcrR family transcriptional regulator